MSNERLGRREFLKLAIASAAAAGLSHFHVLNVGGSGVALARPQARDDCSYTGTASTDVCDPAVTNPDTCPEPPYTGTGTDTCQTPCNPDFCLPTAEPDECEAWEMDPDVCDPGDMPTSDTCDPSQQPPDEDACEAQVGAGYQEPDTCNADDDRDACSPGNEDVCLDAIGGDNDVCVSDYDWTADQCYAQNMASDTCQGATGTQTPDTCYPGDGDPDTPTAVTLSSVDAGSASSALPALGGLAVALGAAAAWIRRRLRFTGSDEPDAE